MNRSIYTGFSSSLAHSQALDVVGNNVANINTTGFKGNSAEFSTLFESMLNTSSNDPAYSDLGNGSRVSSTTLDMSHGSFIQSENIFNMAIEGNGWFGVTNDNIYNASDISYTRDGTFSQNRDGYLVNGDQNYLLGTSYGIISKQSDGSYIIDNTADPVSPNSEVGKQDMLFAPKELYYPHTTTTNAKLQKNLYSESTTQIKPAESQTAIKSMLDSAGELLSIKEEQDMLFSLGTEDAVYSNGKIEYSFLAIDDTTSGGNNATFKINDTSVTATWAEGSDAKTVAAAIGNAITASSPIGVTASVLENSIKITSQESISVQESDYSPIKPVYITRLTYIENGTGENEFSTLSDLSDIIKTGIEEIYTAAGTEVFVNSNGQIKVAAKESDITISFKNAADTNEKLLSNLNSINGRISKNTVSATKDFNISNSNSFQKIIDQDGSENLLYVDISQISARDGQNGAVWNADLKIVNEEDATGLTGADELVSNGKSIGLVENQDMWISVGNGDIRKTTHGYDYAFEAPSEKSDGTGSNISFSVNRTPVSITLEDGSSSMDSASRIVSELKALGIEASANYNEVLIHADKETGSLSITDGSSNITGFDISSHTLKYTNFSTQKDNYSFMTLEDLNDIVQESATDAGLSVISSIENSKFSLTNNGDETVSFRLLQGLDSNKELIALLTPTYDPVRPGNSVFSNPLNTHTVLSEASQQITFDEMSQLDENTQITIKNGTGDLALDISGMTNFATSVYDEYFHQNGEVQSDFEFYDINQNGQIIANFSNGRSAAISEVSLYHFQNEQGLEKIGSNQFIESANSGKAFFYLDSNDKVTNRSTIQSRMLESSNVTTQKALTEMIVLQRSFEGAAKIITTSDELLKNAINMKK